MTANQDIKVLEKCRVAPPPDTTVTDFTLPLTYFDMQFMLCPSVDFVHFYRFRNDPAINHISTSPQTIISSFKSSLSMALKHFLPLAGNLICPINHNNHLQTRLPELRYTKGDSVSLTIAESSEDFDYLVGDHQKDTYKFHSLIPQLPEPILTSSGSQVSPLYALQVTFFPNFGLSIGRAVSHVLGDATTFMNFNKLWSLFFKYNGIRDTSSSSSLESCISPPFYDRSVVQDPFHLGRKIFNDVKLLKSYEDIPTNISSDNPKTTYYKNVVISTFILHRSDITMLKKNYLARNKIKVSTYSITCALVWTCLSKSLDVIRDEKVEVEEDKIEKVCPFINMRPRFDPQIPPNYFGNCVVPCIVGLSHKDLVGNEGLWVAATSIGDAVQNMARDGEKIIRGDWLPFSYAPSTMEPGMLVIVGTTKQSVYNDNSDFSWGELVKYEMISVEPSPIFMVITLSRRFEGALELSFSLPKKRMDAFTTIFTNLIDSLRIRSPL